MYALNIIGQSPILVSSLNTIDDVANAVDPSGTVLSIIKAIIVWIAIIGLFVSIEKAPIKFNPISLLSSMIFKSVNEKMDAIKKDFDSQMSDIKKTLSYIKDEQDRYRFCTIRWEILAFRTALNNGDLFTEVEYQHIKDDYEEYKQLHEKYGFTNGYLEDAVNDIKEHHDKYKDTNTKYF